MTSAIEYTPYRVSTITANGHVGSAVNLDVFFEHFHIANGSTGFVWIELGRDKSKGVYPKKKKTANKKTFDNQATVIYRFREGYMPNIKLFRNGNVQMTGIKTMEDGEMVVERIAGEVMRIAKEKDISIIPQIENIRANDFKVRMINSDFSIPFKIRRKVLHNLLMIDYSNVCSYQPESYPGVKLQYFWREKENHAGRCTCEEPCDGKGGTDGRCKKVTVSVFQSGKVLITGATTYEQINEAYRFICGVVTKHRDSLEWTIPIMPSLSSPLPGLFQ